MKSKILVNFLGTGCVPLLSFLFVPTFISYLGTESYGLLGFFLTLQSIFLIFDFGFSSLLTRELAYRSASENNENVMGDLLRSTETIYWLEALILGAFVIGLSGYISQSWLKLETLPIETAQFVIILMGIATFFRWPISLYLGALFGLQNQILANKIKVLFETIRFTGSFFILKFVSSDIKIFFVWQVLITLFYAFTIRTCTWSRIPKSIRSPAFNRDVLKKIWHFAAGLTGISITAAILTQLDKIILSRLLTLTDFGYYALASGLAMGLAQLSTPFANALYPEFTQLIALNDSDKLVHLYHKSCQYISVLVIPTTLVLFFFSGDFLFLWTHNPSLVRSTEKIFRCLVLGSCLNVLVVIPYTMQLSYKWTNLTLMSNTIAIIIFCPLLFYLTARYGGVGAATIWVTLNSIYLLLNINIMHTRILTHEKWSWLINDIGRPLLGTLPIVLGFALLVGETTSRLGLFIKLMTVFFLASFSAAAMTPCIQLKIRTLYKKYYA